MSKGNLLFQPNSASAVDMSGIFIVYPMKGAKWSKILITQRHVFDTSTYIAILMEMDIYVKWEFVFSANFKWSLLKGMA